MPDSVGLSAQTFRDIGAAALMEHVMHRLGTRVVVKPARGGSALGVAGVDGLAALPSALVGTYAYCEDALVERFHDGVDVSVVVLETDDGLTVAGAGRDRVREGPRVRLRGPLHRRVRLARPAPTSPRSSSTQLGEVARQAHRTLGLRDVSRSDFIVERRRLVRRPRDRDHPRHHRDLGRSPSPAPISGTSLGEVARDLLARAITAGPPV